MPIIELDTYTFDQAVKESSQTPVLVDFWAEWCAPCKKMLPVLEQIAEEMSGTLVVAKVNVDTETDLVQGLSSVPTLRLYRDGKVILEVIGALPKAALKQRLIAAIEEHEAL